MSTPRILLNAGLALLLPLALGACTRTADDAAAPATDAAAAPSTGTIADPPAPAPCNADAVQSLVGQVSSDALVEQARVDSGASSVRALKPGDAATMDYRQDRLNIALDAEGVIEALSCG